MRLTSQSDDDAKKDSRSFAMQFILDLYPLRNHIVNGHCSQRLCQTVELPVHFPLIE